MRGSITPPDLTASSGPAVAVVSSSSVTPEPARASREDPKKLRMWFYSSLFCWFLFIQYQSMEPEFQMLQMHRQIISWIIWNCPLTDIAWTETSRTNLTKITFCVWKTHSQRDTHKDWTVCMWVNNEFIYMFGGTNPLKSQIEIVWNICKHLYYCSTLKKYYLRNNHLYWAFVRKAQKNKKAFTF